MAQKILRVIVVEDDFMIAKMHGKFISEQEGYKLVGTAYNYAETVALMEQTQPDLLLLDVYLPDRSGIELLRTIRSQNVACDVIVITAAKELEIVEEGFRLGVIDYLVKPFELKQLKTILFNYAQFKLRLSDSMRLSQDTIDDFKKIRSTESVGAQVQKGIDIRTLEKIKKCLGEAEAPLSADQIAKYAGVSLTTTRIYLTYLVEEQTAREEQQYGTVGRPLRLYRLVN